MPESNSEDELLVRQFTLTGIWIMIVTGLVGTGIFGVPAEAARLTVIFLSLGAVLYFLTQRSRQRAG